MYTPLYVGKDINQTQFKLVHNQGDNIAEYNDKINECTGLYWIWKNSNEKYVGVNHYRRYFINEDTGEIISNEELVGLLSNYDIIVAKRYNFGQKSLKKQLREDVQIADFEKVYNTFRNIFTRKQPEYIEIFDDIFASGIIIPCNMFVTSKYIMDEYCEWLFSFIIEACDDIDVTMYDDYGRRIVGFLAERMFTIWLCNQSYTIKEMPIIVTE